MGTSGSGGSAGEVPRRTKHEARNPKDIRMAQTKIAGCGTHAIGMASLQGRCARHTLQVEAIGSIGSTDEVRGQQFFEGRCFAIHIRKPWLPSASVACRCHPSRGAEACRHFQALGGSVRLRRKNVEIAAMVVTAGSSYPLAWVRSVSLPRQADGVCGDAPARRKWECGHSSNLSIGGTSHERSETFQGSGGLRGGSGFGPGVDPADGTGPEGYLRRLGRQERVQRADDGVDPGVLEGPGRQPDGPVDQLLGHQRSERRPVRRRADLVHA